nr:hypothetical protein [Streptomyces sp. DSM 41633]
MSSALGLESGGAIQPSPKPTNTRAKRPAQVRGLVEIEPAVEVNAQHASPLFGGQLVERDAVED